MCNIRNYRVENKREFQWFLTIFCSLFGDWFFSLSFSRWHILELPLLYYLSLFIFKPSALASSFIDLLVNTDWKCYPKFWEESDREMERSNIKMRPHALQLRGCVSHLWSLRIQLAQPTRFLYFDTFVLDGCCYGYSVKAAYQGGEFFSITWGQILHQLQNSPTSLWKPRLSISFRLSVASVPPYLLSSKICFVILS